MSLPWFPLWADRLVASKGWRALRNDATAKAVYFALMLAADRDRNSDRCGWVYCRTAAGPSAFATIHALAEEIDLDHRTVERALDRLAEVGLIRRDGLMIEVVKFRQLIHRSPDVGLPADQSASHLAGGMENARSIRPTTYDAYTATPTDSPSESERGAARSPGGSARAVHRRRPADDTAPTSELIDHWKAEHARQGLPPEMRFGRHAKALSDVWQRTGRDTAATKRIITRFFETDHDLKNKNGTSIGSFQAIVARLMEDDLAAGITPPVPVAEPSAEPVRPPAGRDEAAAFAARFRAAPEREGA